MGTFATVIFSDLTGSTAVFEALGNQKATLAVTRLTQLMGDACVRHKGRVVKTLGDGVLAVFAHEADAVDAMVDLQRHHRDRTANWPAKLLMRIKIGMASGEIVQVDDDCYGEPVNLAARLCDLAGPGEIWATQGVVDPVNPVPGVQFRTLGAIGIRGLAGPREVFQIDWNAGNELEMVTQPAPLDAALGSPEESLSGRIELAWLDVKQVFRSASMPIHIGRLSDVEFAVNDPRVSRRHARIDWINNNFVFTDLSSYGTWVRFAGSANEVPLRRGECVLTGEGEISLGAPFSDFSAPTISFTLSEGGVALTHTVKPDRRLAS